MKNCNLGLLSLAVLFLFIGAISCKKDKDDGASSQLSATFSGTAFQPAAVVAMDLGYYTSIMGYQIRSGDTLTLDVTIMNSVALNSKLDFSDVQIDYSNTSGSIYYVSHSGKSHGEATVTTWDKTGKKIAGKFSGVLYRYGSSTDSVVVTNGQFNTSYQ